MMTFEIVSFSLMFLAVILFVLAALPDKWNIINKWMRRKEKIEAKKNPDFMAELVKFEEKLQNYVYLRMLADETKREVDALLVKINYAPADKKSELIEQCEEAKKLLFDCEEDCQRASEELADKEKELDRKRKELGLRWN